MYISLSHTQVFPIVSRSKVFIQTSKSFILDEMTRHTYVTIKDQHEAEWNRNPNGADVDENDKVAQKEKAQREPATAAVTGFTENWDFRRAAAITWLDVCGMQMMEDYLKTNCKRTEGRMRERERESELCARQDNCLTAAPHNS